MLDPAVMVLPVVILADFHHIAKDTIALSSVVPSVVQSDFHHIAKDTSVDSLFEIPERTAELDGASGARTSYCQRACLHMCV